MKAKIKKLRAVGFASYKPMLFVVFGTYSTNKRDPVFLFPPKKEGEEFTLPDQDGPRNYVMVTAAERLRELKSWSSKIYRVMVFAKPEELEKLDIPILDAETQDGRIVRILEQSPDELRERIEKEARLISFKRMLPKPKPKPKPIPKARVSTKVSPKPTSAVEAAQVDPPPADDPKLIAWLKQLRDQFSGSKVEFEDQVLLPSLFRLARQISKAELRKSLKVVGKKGIDSKELKRFRQFLERKGEPGYRLGQAVRAYLKADPKPKIGKLAKQYGQSVLDIRLTIIGLRKFHAR